MFHGTKLWFAATVAGRQSGLVSSDILRAVGEEVGHYVLVGLQLVIMSYRLPAGAPRGRICEYVLRRSWRAGSR